MPSVNDIRTQFLELFRSRGHELPGSSSLSSQDDPTCRRPEAMKEEAFALDAIRCALQGAWAA